MTLPHGSEELLAWATAIAIATAVLSLFVVPWLVSRLPDDYFSREAREPFHRSLHPILGVGLMILKNGFGVILVLLGLVMLVTPGQGLLTLLVGLMLLDFPGKFSVERWLVMRPRVLPALNWLRRRLGKKPLRAP